MTIRKVSIDQLGVHSCPHLSFQKRQTMLVDLGTESTLQINFLFPFVNQKPVDDQEVSFVLTLGYKWQLEQII